MMIEKQEPIQEGLPASPSSETTRRQRPFFLFLVVLGCLAVLSIGMYGLPPTSPLVRAVSRVLPYPAVVVNTSVITLGDYANEYDALIKFVVSADTQKPPSDEVVRQTILEALTNKAAIRALARTSGVKLDQKKVEAFYQDVVKGEESEQALSKQLKETFGWSTQQFKKRIIESIVLAMQMSDSVLHDAKQQEGPRADIQEALKRLDAGEEFTTVAADVQQKQGGAPQGDLGYQSVGSLPTEWAPAASLKIGERTPILESDQGFVILKVVDRIEAGEDSQVHLLAVAVPKKTLEDAVKAYLAEARVWTFIR
ncbi:peptidylprolyl isomerase [Candidatus Uhrbacteria bacterium]|nr:peptidylprolyl isomerase [Candidatus Uhrbacteria bacterium]